VFIKGQQVSVFKLVLPEDITGTIRELCTYAKIQSAGFDAAGRTSRLLGVVGLLLPIEGGNRTLLCSGICPRYSSGRQKWLNQISYSLERLHAHRIIRGDEKPDSVLIDAHDDAYLIDLGGGYTQPWADDKLSNTVEGDLQALQRITDYVLNAIIFWSQGMNPF
jgi:serine/threonine protein kinase